MIVAGISLVPNATVSINIVGIPQGTAPSITVRAPSGERVVRATPEALADLRFTEAGMYRISGTPFRAPDGLIDAIYDPQPELVAEVAPNETTTLTFRYAKRPGTGLLWITSVRTRDDDDFTRATIRAFRLGEGQRPTIELVHVIETGPRLDYGTILPDGTFLFTDSWDVTKVMRLDTRQPSTATLRPAGDAEPRAIFRDPSGRIWLSDDAVARAYRPTADGQLGSPVIELTRDEESDSKPDLSMLVFLHDGSMVVRGSEGLTVVPAAELNRSHVVRPTNWRAMPYATTGYGAVDANGDLWFANENGAVVRVTRAQLEGSGPITPQEFMVEFGCNALTFDAEGGVLAFVRATGDLWRLPPGGSAFAKIGNLGTGFATWSIPVLNPPAVGTPVAAGFPDRTL